MEVTLFNGIKLTLTSLSRKEVKAVQAEQERIDGIEDAREQHEAMEALQERVVGLGFGEEGLAELEQNNREFIKAFNAVLAYSGGWGESAVKNLFGSGGSGPKRPTNSGPVRSTVTNAGPDA